MIFQKIIQIIKPGDTILIAVLMLSVVLQFIYRNHSRKSAVHAVVSVENREKLQIRLDADSVYHVQGYIGESDIEVLDHHIRMHFSPCPHKTCMKMGSISHSGQVIVCIPNRILIRIDGNDSYGLDGVTQ